MAMTKTPVKSGNENLELLLPWYVNGTLDAAGRRRIDDALVRDERLRRSLELALEDRDAVLHANERIGVPSADPLAKVMAAAAASSRASAFALKRSLAERFQAFIGSLSPRVLAGAVTAAAVVLLLQAATIGMLGLDRIGGTGMELASGGEEKTEARIEFVVRFAPGVTVERAGGFLETLDLDIVGGPAGGLYVVAAAVSEETGSAGEKILLLLRARTDIVAFAAKAPGPGE
jgi:hypothetical protein